MQARLGPGVRVGFKSLGAFALMIVLARLHFDSGSVLTPGRETYRRMGGHRDGINFFDYRQPRRVAIPACFA
jgi:hypothetical protein